jgi:hypothetical protein
MVREGSVDLRVLSSTRDASACYRFASRRAFCSGLVAFMMASYSVSISLGRAVSCLSMKGMPPLPASAEECRSRQPLRPPLRRSDGMVLAQGQPGIWLALSINVLHQHRIPGLGVHLNPSTGGIKHGDTVVIIDPHGARVRKRFLKRSVVVSHRQGALADHVWIG